MSPAAPRHISVLGREAVEMLDVRDGGIYVDATFGAGGYSRAILSVAGTQVVGIDRDRSAITGGFDLVEQSGGRLTLVEDRFSNLADVCAAQGMAEVDGVVMDVGVSSMQLDQAERGFSFRLGGPLDMRMSLRRPPRPISPTSSIFSAKSAIPAPSRAPSWRRARKRRSRPRKRWPISSARWCEASRTRFIRRPARSRA
jgi:hypothetical protein